MCNDGIVRIDPEDREQVERLCELASDWADHVPYDPGPGDLTYLDAMQGALRAMLVPPKPPKPEEPLGLGAVVVDSDGEKWVRADPSERTPWMCIESGWRSWSDLAAVEVLSEGVR